MPEHLAKRPLLVRRLSVYLRLARGGERAGEVAIGLVELREDPLRLGERLPRSKARGRDGRGRLPQLEVRRQEREPQAVLVVLLPGVRPLEIGIAEVDARPDQTLDGLGDRHANETSGTPRRVSSASASTTA